MLGEARLAGSAPSTRVSTPWTLPSLHGLDPGASTRLVQTARQFPRLRRLDPRRSKQPRFQLLWGAENIHELCAMLGIHHAPPDERNRVAYNFNHLVDDASGSERTIEFRKHEGTVDYRVAWAWAMICTQLVRFADTSDTKHFRLLVKNPLKS
ncbi:hypothetical protein B0T26DRAFT_723866 [Lasiosphaeria miniovina]|uniref:Uncharacterized protein n=1 Tax=Lasiosphaeria miniovina TaxID=1954250 RepID=A0AA40A659_9PEZI|nr:uncharacterized protein B0T26DRAFT_723866 [Lasiosphaeria miniovina]KAK0710034.1 hypothetical protein B0T26DRAFT_723866 [Lasiosphaeria miniovina]